MVLGANLHPLTSTPAQGWPRRWLHGLRSWLRPRPAAPRALPASAPAPTPDPLARARQEAHEAEAEGRWDAAIRAWGTIVANVSGDVPARLRLAEAFMAAGSPRVGWPRCAKRWRWCGGRIAPMSCWPSRGTCCTTTARTAA